MATPCPPPKYSFRPMALIEGAGGVGGDLPFLRELYASTRREEMALSGWPEEQIEAFLRQQFEAQHRFYMAEFSGAAFKLILGEEGEPIGRLYLEERDDEFRVIDIALMPPQRGKGIGGRIMQDIIDRAAQAHKAVRIHVEKNNPAMQFYRRLGFTKVEDQGVYDLMEWATGKGVTA
jgi:ribosomal protein S18 acetylase RimI-like enzyme